MSRHRKFQIPDDGNPALDISSLIDVCFLLLIYFIVTSTIQPREQDLSLALPGMSSNKADQPDIEPFLISVDANGAVSTGLGADQVTLDTDVAVRSLPLLDAQLKLYKDGVVASGQQPLVQVYASPDATQQRVIDVLNSLSGQGISAVTFTDLLDE